MRTIILISANTEWNEVKKFLQPDHINNNLYGECFDFILDNHPVTLLHAGWGKTASAGAMQYVIDRLHPDITINLGTCGGIGDLVSLNETILVEGTFMYDILDLMGSSNTPTRYYYSQLDLSWLPEPFPHSVRKGILASADSDLRSEKITLLKSQGAIAADWESGTLAWVANKNKARLLILRTVSDMVTEKGGEVYGNIKLYKERTQGIMRKLLEQLPDWLRVIRHNIVETS